MASLNCIACGDLIRGPKRDDNPHVVDAMKVYCQTCAKEILGLAIPFVGSLQHDTGGGRRVIRETKTH